MSEREGGQLPGDVQAARSKTSNYVVVLTIIENKTTALILLVLM